MFGKSGGTPGFGIGKIGDDPFADKVGDDPFANKVGDDPFADKVCDALFKRMEIENARRDLERARAEAKLIGCMPSLEACLLSAALIRRLANIHKAPGFHAGAFLCGKIWL